MTRTDPACSTNTLLIIQSIQYFIVVLHNVDEVGTPLMSSADTFNVFIIRQSRTQRTVRTIQRFYSLILLQREIKLNTFSWRERERGEERRGWLSDCSNEIKPPPQTTARPALRIHLRPNLKSSVRPEVTI